MKLTAIMLVFCCINVSARSFSQKLTINRNNASLTEILQDINNQTGYSYSISSESLGKTKPISIHVINVNLTEVLDICFKDQPVFYQIKDNVIIVALRKIDVTNNTVVKENNFFDIKGRVINEKGEGVVASISVKGTKIVVSSNSNGEFNIPGSYQSATLIITGINIEPLETIARDKGDLFLIHVKSKIIENEEVSVVNTGYQMTKPNEVLGSVVVIDKETLARQSGSNVLKRLDGVTSGLYFNIGKSSNPGIGTPSKTNISIRGLSTINWSLDPLIVVDNFPYEGNIENINPNDVENITILKDGAATSLYGARGGNGVIVITTKHANFDSKLRISVNSNLTITKRLDLFSLSQISPRDYIDMEKFLFERGYFTDAINSIFLPALSPAVNIFYKRANGLITPADSAMQINSLKENDSRNEYNKYFNKAAITQQYTLTLQGGNNNLAWLISGSYDKSILPFRNRNDKINVYINNIYKPIRNLDLSISAYYTNSRANNTNSTMPYNGQLISGRLVPYIKYANDSGSPLPVAINYRNEYTDTVGSGKLLDWNYYPLTDYDHNRTIVKLEEIKTNFRLKYRISNDLNLEVLYQYQQQRIDNRSLSDIESYYTRDLINKYTIIDGLTGNLSYPIAVGNILNISNSVIGSNNFRSQANFHKTWSNHFVSAVGGFEVREAINKNGPANTYYGYRSDPLSYAITDFVNSYNVRPVDFPLQIPGQPVMGYKSINRFASAYINGLYTYKDLYSLSLSARRDGANIFGASTNNKWRPLWSAGMGWDISKESFYRVKWLPDLKIKSTMGYSGNISPDKTALPVARYLGNNSISNFPMAQITQLNDPSLRWEKVKQINFGIVFSTRKQIVSGSIEYYIKQSRDLYGPVPFDYTRGGNLDQINKNVANMKGNGVDVILTSKLFDKTIKWKNIVLFNYNSNKVTAYFNPSAQYLASKISGGNTIIPVVGKPLYAISAYKWAGLDQNGDPQGYLNGHPSTDYDAIFTEASLKGVNGNLKYFGPSNPPFFGSFINDFSWKNFTVSINISYRFGYYFMKPSLNYNTLFLTGIGTSDFAQRWKNPGDEHLTNIPAMVYTDYPHFENRNSFFSGAEVNVLKADNIRIQYVDFLYSIPLKNQTVINSLQAYINLANMGIIWRSNKEKLDPDYPTQFAPSKQFTLGIRMNL